MINGRNELLQQDHDKLRESGMKAIEGLIRTPRTADSFTYVMPNIGMELLVLEEGKSFRNRPNSMSSFSQFDCTWTEEA